MDHTIFEQIARRRASIIGFLAGLGRADSTTPPGDTRKVADLIAARLRGSSVDFQILSDEQRKPNVIARLGSGHPELLFTSHMDTVPAGNLKAWRHEPFGAEIVGTRMHGRGAAGGQAPLPGVGAG